MNVGYIKYVAAAFKIQGPYLSTVCLSKKRQTVVCFFSESFTQKAPLWWPVRELSFLCGAEIKICRLLSASAQLERVSGSWLANLSRSAEPNPCTVCKGATDDAF